MLIEKGMVRSADCYLFCVLSSDIKTAHKVCHNQLVVYIWINDKAEKKKYMPTINVTLK